MIGVSINWWTVCYKHSHWFPPRHLTVWHTSRQGQTREIRYPSECASDWPFNPARQVIHSNMSPFFHDRVLLTLKYTRCCCWWPFVLGVQSCVSEYLAVNTKDNEPSENFHFICFASCNSDRENRKGSHRKVNFVFQRKPDRPFVCIFQLLFIYSHAITSKLHYLWRGLLSLTIPLKRKSWQWTKKKPMPTTNDGQFKEWRS